MPRRARGRAGGGLPLRAGPPRQPPEEAAGPLRPPPPRSRAAAGAGIARALSPRAPAVEVAELPASMLGGWAALGRGGGTAGGELMARAGAAGRAAAEGDRGAEAVSGGAARRVRGRRHVAHGPHHGRHQGLTSRPARARARRPPPRRKRRGWRRRALRCRRPPLPPPVPRRARRAALHTPRAPPSRARRPHPARGVGSDIDGAAAAHGSPPARPRRRARLQIDSRVCPAPRRPPCAPPLDLPQVRLGSGGHPAGGHSSCSRAMRPGKHCGRPR